MEPSDRDLLARYRHGDVEALGTLVDRYRAPLFGYILKMTLRQADAEEIFQEVWLKAMRRLSGYSDRNLLGWLVRIAHNLVVDRARRRKPVLADDVHGDDDRQSWQDNLPGGGRDPAAEAADCELGDAIRNAVAQLPVEQREVFLLRTQADMAFKEIASVQGVSINTALARMQYALGRLRPLLREDYEALSRRP